MKGNGAQRLEVMTEHKEFMLFNENVTTLIK